MNMQRIGVIPARSGSKRLKGKNSLPFCGMTLVEISVRCAIAARIFNKIIISSDDISHKKYEESSDLIAYHSRPHHLASDQATSVEVLKDVCEHYRLRKEDFICMLQPTSPLRLPCDIRKSMGASSVSVCTKSIDTPFLRHSVAETYAKYNIMNKTYFDHQKLYFNGAVYWIRIRELYLNNLLVSDKTVLFQMPEYRSIDIDFKNEFDLAEERFKELDIFKHFGGEYDH